MAAQNQQQPGIIWLASYPKSGNTWTRAFLHNLMYIVRGETGDELDINKMNEFSTWDLSSEKYATVLGKPAVEATRTEIAAARPKIQAQIADEVDGLSFVKTHNALVVDRGHSTINFSVTSGAIYIMRNPLDVAVSFSHHMSATIDETIDYMSDDGAETSVTDKSVYEVYGSWSHHVASWTAKPHRAIYLMRYEDMLADPEKTFGDLAHHILLKPTKKQLQEAIDKSSFDKLRAQESKSSFSEKPKDAENFFREGRAEQWRERLSSDQVQRIISDHKEQMSRFGYFPID